MINFDEEIKKYKPSLEIDQAEEAVQQNDFRDVIDIVEELVREYRNDEGKKMNF